LQRPRNSGKQKAYYLLFFQKQSLYGTAANKEDRDLMEAAIQAQAAKKRKLRKKIISRVLFYLAAGIVAFWMVLPFFWSLLSSFRNDIRSDNLSFFPSELVLEHYKRVFEEENVMFFRRLGNSVLTTLAGIFTNLFFGTLAAYAFSKLRFSGHKIIFNIMFVSMMIPGVITLVPTFMVIVRFPLAGGNNILGQGGRGLYDNLLSVILPGSVGVYGIFFMRQFLVTLSDEFAESARIDGAGELTIFFRIYLPLVLPALLTLGIFTFQGGWNNFMWPNIVLIDNKRRLLTQAFSVFKSPNIIDYGPLLALSVLMAAPVLAFFLAAQRWFIHGVALGGVKE
jgi:multiple sugar transport system permease protein